MEWVYQGKPALVVPEGMIGFVYITTYTDGSYYIGKKNVYSNKIVPAIKSTKEEEIIKRLIVRNKEGYICKTKHEKAEARRLGCVGRMEDYRKVVKENKWKTYEGSSTIKSGYTLKSKEILAWCPTNISMTYIEARMQFVFDALFDPKCLNLNILGKFYPNCLEGVKWG